MIMKGTPSLYTYPVLPMAFVSIVISTLYRTYVRQSAGYDYLEAADSSTFPTYLQMVGDQMYCPRLRLLSHSA
jgi:hypothetical protein